ncbi:acyltransferase 3 [Minicystis rosea]|nr:acyltransferase 3 [Minicystis rosea]
MLPQLDALRGIAILAVFVQHLGDRFMPLVEATVDQRVPRALAPWILTALHHAHWGVDLFFVLSGFSLAQGYLRAFDAGRSAPTARTFLLRRAARILPGYYVALLVTLAFHRAVVGMPGFGAALAMHSLVLQGYFAPGGIVIIGAAWSLTTEVHFYLLLPLLARPLLDRARGTRRYWIGAALVVAAWLSRAWLHEIVLHPGVHTGLLEATQRRWITSRLDQFVLGALAATAHAEIDRARLGAIAARFAPAAIALSLVVLLIGFRLEGELYLDPHGSWPYAIISMATAGLVLAATLAGDGLTRILAPAPLTAIGVVSYGVFLYHQLAIGLVGSVLRAPGLASLAANAILALALAVAAGTASWLFVERPVMRWAAARSPRR